MAKQGTSARLCKPSRCGMVQMIVHRTDSDSGQFRADICAFCAAGPLHIYVRISCARRQPTARRSCARLWRRAGPSAAATGACQLPLRWTSASWCGARRGRRQTRLSLSTHRRQIARLSSEFNAQMQAGSAPTSKALHCVESLLCSAYRMLYIFVSSV